MNRYSRVFHHISLDDIKRNRLKAENSRKSFLESVRRAREFLRDLNSPYYSNWRNSSLKEDMTTDSVFFTTFPGTGEANLETIDANDASAYTAAGGQDALNGTSIKASGTGEGSDGGFDLGQSYLAFDGTADSRHAILDPIDSTKFDTLVIDAIVGNDSNGGEDPDEAGEELRLYYLEPDGDSFKSISVNTAGEQVLSANADVLIDLGAGSGALQQFSINLPSHARGTGFTYMLYQLSNSGAEFDHYGITNIKYQRRNPISLLVSLDSPEATSMIRDGGDLTSAEKKKQLEDMLAASDEYMETMFPTNQEAMKRAEENLKRNIDISLDPNTFKFPEYGTPEYNQMFNPYMDADSDIEQIKNSLESKGLSLDNLEKDFNSQKGTFTSLGQEGTLILLNNPDTQEQTLTAMGIDLGLLTNYTPDSWDKIGKITNLKPGGTPATGWDGKFYEYDDPLLEASQVIPLETYLQVKGTDNYIGVERPDRAEPGKRYVMEKEYSFSTESTPTYTGVRNKDIEERNDRTYYKAITGDIGDTSSVNGHSYDYALYTGSDQYLGGSKYMLRQLAGTAARSLNYINQQSDFLAYDFLSNYQNGEAGGVYKDLYNQYKDTDVFNNYDPLWVWNSDPRMSKMLTLLRGISSGRDLDSPSDYYYSGTDAAERARQDAAHRSKNDRLYDDLQRALKLFDSPRTLSQYEKNEWYLERDSDDRVTGVRTTHPYSGLPEPGLTPEEPTPEEPQESEKNYPPELNDLGGQAWEQGNTITKEGFKKSDGDFDIFAAGGGNAKMAQGFTYEQVMEIGRKNLNVAKLKNIDNKGDMQVRVKGGDVQLLNYQTNLGHSAGADGTYNTGGDFAAMLAPELGISILTGQSREMKVSGRAKEEMIDSIDYMELERALQIGPAIKPSVSNAVSPTPGKKLQVLTGVYGVPGAVEVNYDPGSDTFTITSNKMLRTGESGDQFYGDRQTRFGDIPSPSSDSIAQLGGQIVTRMFGSVGIKPPGGLSTEAQAQVLKQRYTDTQWVNAMLGVAAQVMDFTVQGSASNIVAMRKLMTDVGIIKKSAMEKTGGGYGHVYSQTSYTGSEIPQSLRQYLNRRMSKDDLGGGSLGDTLQGTGAGDAATAAADTQSKKKKKVTEMYEPKAKHNEKITKHPKMKSPKEFFKRADIKPVYPDTPPPEMVNGRHPDWRDDTKLAKRFVKLDPESARAMPDTGSPQVDALIRAARKKPK